MSFNTMLEHDEALSEAAEASVKVQLSRLTNSEAREGAGAAETIEPSTARPRSWKECMIKDGLVLVNRTEKKNEWREYRKER